MRKSQVVDDGVHYVIIEDPKKNRGSGILIILLLLVVAGVGFLGYKGYSALRNNGLFGGGLGIQTSADALESFETKLGFSIQETPADVENYTQVWGKPEQRSAQITSEEMTSYLDSITMVNSFADDLQVSFAKDGVVSAYASLNSQALLNLLNKSGYSAEALGNLPILPKNLPLQMDMKINVSGNKVTELDVSKFSLMGMNIPALISTFGDVLNIDELSEQGADLEKMISSELVKVFNDGLAALNAKNGMYISNLSVSDGKLNLDGNIPTSMEWVKK